MEVCEENKESAVFEEEPLDQIQLDPSEFLELDIECDNVDANDQDESYNEIEIDMDQLIDGEIVLSEYSDETKPVPTKIKKKGLKEILLPKNHAQNDPLAFDEELFACDECGESFTKINYLRRHKESHLGLKCEICGKCFKRKDALTIHNRLHTGVRPYSCDECGKSYPTKGCVINHQKQTHGQKSKITKTTPIKKAPKQELKNEKTSFSCEVCLQSFSKLDECLKHEQGHIDIFNATKASGKKRKADEIFKDKPKNKKKSKTIKREKSEENFSITDDNEVDFSNQTFKDNYMAEDFFSCFICDAIFDDNNELMKHKLSHLEGLKDEENLVEKSIDTLEITPLTGEEKDS